ncbi:hypothetical protein [Mycobacterium uberis]|uniref:hypothetical protein n=1 Tax=Mycobacterium uberis TaxID=2162698 RepID=UPI001FB3150C|nr:hypothetical protein [Mycobacterium uberis]
MTVVTIDHHKYAIIIDDQIVNVTADVSDSGPRYPAAIASMAKSDAAGRRQKALLTVSILLQQRLLRILTASTMEMLSLGSALALAEVPA